jgi:hypothetical protein
VLSAVTAAGPYARRRSRYGVAVMTASGTALSLKYPTPNHPKKTPHAQGERSGGRQLVPPLAGPWTRSRPNALLRQLRAGPVGRIRSQPDYLMQAPGVQPRRHSTTACSGTTATPTPASRRPTRGTSPTAPGGWVAVIDTGLSRHADLGAEHRAGLRIHHDDEYVAQVIG